MRAAAARVVAAIRQMDVGPPNSFHALVEVARLTHCHVDAAPGGAPSYCAVECDENVAGVILLDALACPCERTRQMAHELTHHLLRWWTPLLSDAEEAALALAGPRSEMEERVCREVEAIVCPAAAAVMRDRRGCCHATFCR